MLLCETIFAKQHRAVHLVRSVLFYIPLKDGCKKYAIIVNN
jgi:hypothetical protein